MPRENVLKKDALTNLAILVVALGSLYLAFTVWEPDEVRGWIESAGLWAPLALVAMKTSTIVFAPLAGGFLYPIAGGLFGFWNALGLLILGDAIGGTIAFWISRVYGRGIAEKFLGGDDNSLFSNILGTMGTVRGFFITRLLLMQAQDITAYAAGLTRLPFLPFLTIHVVVGSIPTIILTALGSVLLESPSAGSLGLILAGSSVVGVISFLGYVWFTGARVFEKIETTPRDSG
jgi:uncharacterized membrane protein YdjX (TVP38/TMEM64 family)